MASLGVKSVQGGGTSGVSGCSSNAGSYFSSNNSKNSISPYSASPLVNFYHQNAETMSNDSDKLKIQSTMPMPTKMPHPKLVRRHSTVQPSKISNLTNENAKDRQQVNNCNQGNIIVNTNFFLKNNKK